MRLPVFRIMRRTRLGGLIEVQHPLIRDVTGCFMHAATADEALANARRFFPLGDIEAIPESN
jgi:hypothetical protein